MNKIVKIKTSDYRRAGYMAFKDKYGQITQAVVSNSAVFVNMPIPPGALESAGQELETKTNNAVNGSQNDKDLRNMQVDICMSYLDTLALYVMQLAGTKPTLNEQIEVVNLSKFKLAKIHHEPAPPLPKVNIVKGEWTGNEGEAFIEWDRIRSGAVLYHVYTTQTDPAVTAAEWTFAGSTTRKSIKIGSLPPLSRVWVRLVAVGKSGETSVPSDPALISIG